MVLYPGLVLPLHIFEERYRQLVRDLLEGPRPGQFGVIAIRKGRETGIDGISALHDVGCTATLRQVTKHEDGRYDLALHDVGCTATLRQVTKHEDGRYDLVTVGTQRFRLIRVDGSRPYLRGEVQLLDEQTGDEAAAAVAAQVVRAAFRSYLDL